MADRRALIDAAVEFSLKAYDTDRKLRTEKSRELLAGAYGLARTIADMFPEDAVEGARWLLCAANCARALGWRREVQDLCDDARSRTFNLSVFVEAERILSPEPRW